MSDPMTPREGLLANLQQENSNLRTYGLDLSSGPKLSHEFPALAGTPEHKEDFQASSVLLIQGPSVTNQDPTSLKPNPQGPPYLPQLFFFGEGVLIRVILYLLGCRAGFLRL